ncbi:hypothetical protein [Vibrio vulnificus]|uniref:hypothetical protein n=1 Tax=Vibrio vulnificus TaxID=672 RepID=UPI00355B0CE9
MAFLVCGEFCSESGLRKVGLGGIHPLTQRYMNEENIVNLPNVKVGDWIQVGENKINAYVFHIFDSKNISAGYFQNRMKAIKDDFLWDGEAWQFKYSGPSGSYLKGSEEMIVKQGPYKR